MSKRSIEKTQFLADVIITATEGGTGYWARTYGYTWDEGAENTSATLVDFEDAATALDHEPGGLFDGWDWLDNAVEAKDERIAKVTYSLTIDTVAKAYGLINKGSVEEASTALNLAQSYVTRLRLAYRTNDAGEIDAYDADIVAQLATIGKIIYG